MMRGVKVHGCSVDGCDRPHFGRGLCNLHYNRWRRTGTTDPPIREGRRCSVDGCSRVHMALGLCELHYSRFRSSGSVGSAGPERVNGVITSYSGAHQMLVRVLGPASDRHCVDCDRPADEWSYDHPEQGSFAWSDDVGDYSPRCRPCHRTKDRKEASA